MTERSGKHSYSSGKVLSVSFSSNHTFSKAPAAAIHLSAGIGVEGDAHSGATVRHRSRIRKDPSSPNLRQVHLIHAELLDELRDAGFTILPGQLGENITTLGIDLLHLPVGTRLHLGDQAVVELTGLRDPCSQIDAFQNGLKAALLDVDQQGKQIRKAGVMGIVIHSGYVRPGDPIRTALPPYPHKSLDVV